MEPAQALQLTEPFRLDVAEAHHDAVERLRSNHFLKTLVRSDNGVSLHFIVLLFRIVVDKPEHLIVESLTTDELPDGDRPSIASAVDH